MDKQEIFGALMEILVATDPDLDVAAIELDDRPFREYGLDSMGLIKLTADVEDRFGIEIDDADAMVAFSFERLVDLIEEKLFEQGPVSVQEDDAPATAAPAAAAPVAAATPAAGVNFYAAVRDSALASGDAARLTAMQSRGPDIVLTHERLVRTAAWLGERLPAARDEQPRTLVVVATEPLPTVIAFFAALGAGVRPLIMPAPKSLGGVEAFCARLATVTGGFGGTVAVALQEGLLPADAALPDVPFVALPTALEGYGTADELPDSPSAGGDDVAFLQMTSASTGDPKLVAISHTNVTSNLESMRAALAMGADNPDGPGESIVSWLPLNHDMGLIGGMLFPLINGFPNVIMKPQDFIRNPARWIRALSDHKATFGGCPNFGWDYAALAVKDTDLAGVDLSSCRRMAVAAEPIHRAALQRFVDRFAPYGFRPDAFIPGLGLAESTLASTVRPGLEPRYLMVDPGGTAIGSTVKVYDEGVVKHPAAPAPETPGVAVFSLGRPLRDLTVKLRADDGSEITGDAVLGEVTIGGPSITVGYYDAAAERPVPLSGDAVDADGALRTGDLGFFESGELFLLGRMKNVIIRRGANFVTSLLEERVGQILGIPPFGIALLDEDIHDPDSPIHVVVENAWDGIELTDEQRSALLNLDLPVDVVTFARGFAIPRTTSGKKRYHVTRDALRDGSFDVVQQFSLRIGR